MRTSWFLIGICAIVFPSVSYSVESLNILYDLQRVLEIKPVEFGDRKIDATYTADTGATMICGSLGYSRLVSRKIVDTPKNAQCVAIHGARTNAVWFRSEECSGRHYESISCAR